MRRRCTFVPAREVGCWCGRAQSSEATRAAMNDEAALRLCCSFVSLPPLENGKAILRSICNNSVRTASGPSRNETLDRPLAAPAACPPCVKGGAPQGRGDCPPPLNQTLHQKNPWCTAPRIFTFPNSLSPRERWIFAAGEKTERVYCFSNFA